MYCICITYVLRRYCICNVDVLWMFSGCIAYILRMYCIKLYIVDVIRSKNIVLVKILRTEKGPAQNIAYVCGVGRPIQAGIKEY